MWCPPRDKAALADSPQAPLTHRAGQRGWTKSCEHLWDCLQKGRYHQLTSVATLTNSCSVSKGKKSEQLQIPAAAFPNGVHAHVTSVRGRKVICVDPPPKSSIPTLLFCGSSSLPEMCDRTEKAMVGTVRNWLGTKPEVQW